MKDQAPIDITTLAMEPPRVRETLTFNPERDITPQDRQEIKNLLETDKINGSWVWYGPYAYFTLSLFPHRAEEFGLNQIPPEAFNYLRGVVHGANSNRRNVQKGLRELIYLKTPTPLEFSAGRINPKYKRRLRQNVKSYSGSEELIDAVALIILFPEETISLTDEDWKKIKTRLKTFPAHGGSYTQFLKQEMILISKVFFPNRCHELEPPGLSSREQVQASFDLYRRHGEWGSFLITAYMALLLSTQQVKVTDRGIELVFDRSEPFKEQIPPMPVTRRF